MENLVPGGSAGIAAQMDGIAARIAHKSLVYGQSAQFCKPLNGLSHLMVPPMGRLGRSQGAGIGPHSPSLLESVGGHRHSSNTGDFVCRPQIKRYVRFIFCFRWNRCRIRALAVTLLLSP